MGVLRQMAPEFARYSSAVREGEEGGGNCSDQSLRAQAVAAMPLPCL
jgi:hypothetical protein